VVSKRLASFGSSVVEAGGEVREVAAAEILSLWDCRLALAGSGRIRANA
jgi:hypothetical protein